MIASFGSTFNDFPENGPNMMMKEEDGGKVYSDQLCHTLPS